MLIRINTQGNVDTYTKPDGGMGRPGPPPGHLRPQHPLHGQRPVPGDDPDRSPPPSRPSLRATFPCNRIIALNGMSFDPTQAGYAFTGIDDPNVYALLTDYEQDDWNSGRLDRPRPPALGRPTSRRPSRCCGAGTSASPRPSRPTRSAPASGPVSPHRTSLTGTSGRSPRTSTSRTPGSAPASSGRMSVQTQDACADGRRRRLRRPGQAAAPPIHLQVHHQEGQRSRARTRR